MPRSSIRRGAEDEIGVCYTRTGRRFFNDRNLETRFLGRVQSAATKSGIWDELERATGCAIDCRTNAVVGEGTGLASPAVRAHRGGCSRWLGCRQSPLCASQATRLPETAPNLPSRYEKRGEMAEQYIEAYRRYCWTVYSLADLKLAPFHLLASEGVAHTDKDHLWHMKLSSPLAAADPGLLLATPYKVVDPNDETSQSRGDWVVGGT